MVQPQVADFLAQFLPAGKHPVEESPDNRAKVSFLTTR